MKPLEPGDEVVLFGPAAASAENFSPHYGLVVKDHGWDVTGDGDDVWDVTVLWDDNKERLCRRKDLRLLSELGRS